MRRSPNPWPIGLREPNPAGVRETRAVAVMVGHSEEVGSGYANAGGERYLVISVALVAVRACFRVRRRSTRTSTDGPPGSSVNPSRLGRTYSSERRIRDHPPGTVRDDPTGPSGSRQVPSASASETCPRAAQLHLGLLEAPQAVSGRAVEYFTCFMEIFDFTFPTPAILANRFTQNSRKSSRSRATTRST